MGLVLHVESNPQHWAILVFRLWIPNTTVQVAVTCCLRHLVYVSFCLNDSKRVHERIHYIIMQKLLRHPRWPSSFFFASSILVRKP